MSQVAAQLELPPQLFVQVRQVLRQLSQQGYGDMGCGCGIWRRSKSGGICGLFETGWWQCTNGRMKLFGCESVALIKSRVC